MKSFIKRGMSGLLAFLMCFTALFGAGSTTAFAASETSESYMISFPRDGDANQVYGTDTWGHPAKNFMNGWYTEENTTWTVHAQESFEGQVCYCIEPGVHREIGDTYSGFGENFWDNYPSSFNNTIEPDTIKVLLGRIMQYGYQGNVSTGWRSQNDADADKLAHDMATQILVWETVIGERDAEFNHVDTGGKDTAKSCIAPGNPLYSRFCTYYDSMVASVKSHTVIPSFMARSSGKAQSVELAWNGSEYTATLTDTNNVLSKFTFSSDMAGLKFSVNGNKLTITSDTAPTGAVAITAEKGQLRSGVLVWSDSKYGPSGGIQDVITYSATVSDPVKAFLNVTVSYGGLKIVKTSEDGKVSGITFTVKGNGVDETVTSDKNGEITIENLQPGTYTITEVVSDAYEPQDAQTITVESGKTATVTFNNSLKRGSLQITKTAEDGLVEGLRFHLFGTSASGAKVDEYATTNAVGVATFESIPIGTGYTVEEVDTANKYIVPDSQSAAIEWNKVTNLSFDNTLKRGDLEITKTSEDGLVEGVKFHLFGTATNGDEVDLYATTNSSGVAKFTNVLIGSNYTVEEVETADRYVVPAEQKTPIEWNKVMKLSFENELKRGDLQVTKTSEDGLIEGVEFHLYGTALNGESIDVYAATNAEGVAAFKDILIGSNYTIEEVNTKAWYIVPENQTAPIEWEKVTSLSFDNVLKRGSLKVVKTSEDGLNEGVKFHLYGTSDSGIAVDEYAVTDENGVATFSNILIGSGYVIEEVDTDIRYVVPENQEGAVEWNKVTQKSFENILKKFRVTLTKVDSETGEPQGDAKLSGAVYGLYKGDEFIESYTTDENGQFTTDYYPCGDDWSIREITPSEGYLLDEESYHVGAEAKLYTVELNITEIGSKEEIIKGNIAIIKHCDNGETGVDTPEAGAKFEIYLKSAGSFEDALDSERDLLICDEFGYAESKMLPYGTYTVHQVSGWDGRELMPDFDVYISNNDQTYRFLLNNAVFESYIKVVKVDSETGKTIPYAGAGFQIYNPEGELVSMTYTYPEVTVIDTFYTTSDGTLITPEKLAYGKGYSLVEVQAPYGYVLDATPISFDVDEDNSTEEGEITLIVVEKTNAPQKGIVSILKTGEVFSSVIQNGDLYTPVYEVKGLAGAVYEITAAEDVVTPDGTVRYTAGTLVDTITTDDSGLARSGELYLGKYQITETSAPYGMVLNTEPQTVELVYAGQEIALTETSASFCNERQKVEISLLKVTEKNDIFGIGENGEVTSVKFGLYAAKEITATDGSTIPAEGLLAIASCNENGEAVFECDVPVDSELYVKEISADAHYIVSETMYPVSFDYQGQDVAEVKLPVNDGKEIDNELIYGAVRGLKVDEDGLTVPGATFGLFYSEETVFDREHAIMCCTTNEEGMFTFEKLVYGDYAIREIEPAEGFVLNETIYPVTIRESNELVEIGFENLHITGTVEVTKVDKDYPENKLTGAEFEVWLDLDGDKKYDAEKDILVGLMKEAEIGIYRMEGLRYGGYFVYERTAPEGFQKDDGFYFFEIREDGKTVIVENEAGIGFINKARTGSIRIEKTSEDGVLKGFTFRVEGKDACGNTFSQEYMTDEKGQILIEGLRIGEYTVSEVSNEASAKYVLPENVTLTVLEDKTTVAKFYNELKPEVPDIPKTGDDTNMPLWAAIAAASLVGIGATVFVMLQKKRKGDAKHDR